MAVNLNIKNKNVLVLGGGKVGLRKINKLLKVGALIKVVEKNPTPHLLALETQLTIYNNFTADLLNKVVLIFLATGDLEFNLKILKLAEEKNIFVNAADFPQTGNMFLPASFSEDDFLFTASSYGASPALAKKIIKDFKENCFPDYKILLKVLKKLRPLLINSKLQKDERKTIFNNIVNSKDLLLSLKEENDKNSVKILNKILNNNMAINELILK